MYFFIENTILSVNGEEIKLSPFSYVIAKYNNYVSYYDRASDTYQTIKTNDAVTVKNEYYTIDVSKDTIDYYGDNILLTVHIESLNTRDKKG